MNKKIITLIIFLAVSLVLVVLGSQSRTHMADSQGILLEVVKDETLAKHFHVSQQIDNPRDNTMTAYVIADEANKILGIGCILDGRLQRYFFHFGDISEYAITDMYWQGDTTLSYTETAGLEQQSQQRILDCSAVTEPTDIER